MGEPGRWVSSLGPTQTRRCVQVVAHDAERTDVDLVLLWWSLRSEEQPLRPAGEEEHLLTSSLTISSLPLPTSFSSQRLSLPLSARNAQALEEQRKRASHGMT